jgi:hypothetical protein
MASIAGTLIATLSLPTWQNPLDKASAIPVHVVQSESFISFYVGQSEVFLDHSAETGVSVVIMDHVDSDKDPDAVHLLPPGQVAHEFEPTAPTNAQRLRDAAQKTLDQIVAERLTGNARNDCARSMIYTLWSHAVFMGEPLPGVQAHENPKIGGLFWDGTAYAALQRIAKGK